MSVIFKTRTKHDRLDLLPTIPLAFADEGAETYFISAGFADPTTLAPLVTYPKGSVHVDPMTIHASDGKFVQPEAAQAAMAANQTQEG
jgi:hypothetical protein